MSNQDNYFLTREILEFARQNGCIAGVCPAAEPDAARALLELRNAEIPFVSRDLEKRLNPAAHLEGAKSVIVLGRFYGGAQAEGETPSPVGLLTSMAQGEGEAPGPAGLLTSMAQVKGETPSPAGLLTSMAQGEGEAPGPVGLLTSMAQVKGETPSPAGLLTSMAQVESETPGLAGLLTSMAQGKSETPGPVGLLTSMAQAEGETPGPVGLLTSMAQGESETPGPVGMLTSMAQGKSETSDPVGLLTSMAQGGDYHAALRSLLEELARLLGEKARFRHTVKVDSPGLLEREYAKMAGLGFQGKNCCVICPGKGSFFNIGLLITDLELPPTGEDELWPSAGGHGCEGCDLCVKACPAGAIAPGGYHIDAARCVSYLTQKNGELSAWERKTMGRWVYGCDVCQAVCPHNAAARAEPARLDLERLLGMASADFDAVFANTCAAWRGRKILRRNAENAARNAGIGSV